MKKFYICLTFDTDPDPDKGYIDRKDKNIIGWKGLRIGNKLIFKSIKKIENKYQINIPTTWFVRVDDQIKYYHGSAEWLITTFSNFWQKVIKNNGSIQWHVHLNSMKNKEWFRETHDSKIKKIIKKNLILFSKILKKPRCIRIGEAFINNNIANYLNKLKIEADSSALPGRKRFDKYKVFDWSYCLNKPYFMNKKNYQKRKKNPKTSDLIEIPMNTIKTKCSYDKIPIKRYCNLSFKNKILKKNLSEYIKLNDLVVTMTHPFEIVSSFKTLKNSNLISFSINEFEKNLEDLILFSLKNKKTPIFVNIENVIDKMKNVQE